MKKIFNIFFIAVLAIAAASCNDFLDRESKTTMDDNNYWSSEGNLRLFVNSAYNQYFSGYSDNWGQVYAPGVYSSGEFSDDRTTTGTQENILISVPADNWYRAELTYRGYWLARRGSSPWNFAYVRKWNLLIERLDMMKEKGVLTDEAYNHWMGIARFFRGFEYSRLVESFGDVPYYDKPLSAEDLEQQFAPRIPRVDVMKKVMEDFDFAMANVRENDGTDYVNRYVVGVVASRCLLFEGTWYIYHKNDEAMKTNSNVDAAAKQFLEKARDYAAVVVNSGKFKFDTDFRTLFGTLYKRPASNEILLYRAYNKSVYNSAQHCIASYSNGDESQTCAGNLSTLKAWICQDGKPYATSEVKNVKSWRLQDMVTTRDPRFEATFWDEPKASATGLYCEKFIDREGPTYSYNGKTRPTYYASDTNENGYPCIRYSEAVLNWIEAIAELASKFGGAAVTQDDLDKSINAIRQRPLDDEAIAKGVKKTAPLQLADAKSEDFDPERKSAAQQTTLGYKTTGFVDPIIWEIRRERRMEFFMEQYRVLDIRRWGQLELMLGANNPDLLVGGYVELDLAATLTEKQAAELHREPQTTNLKKSLNNVGYNLLTEANSGKVSIRPIVGYNADGTMILGERTFFKVEDDGSSNYAEMRGFLVPMSIADRDPRNVDVRNYLEPVCTQVIDQYKEKDRTITQNPGWE